MSLYNHIKATVKPGQCRSCAKQLTQQDKDQFKNAWTNSAPFPTAFKRYLTQFCVKCIRTYQLSQMNAEQRVEFLRETKEKLQGKKYTVQDIQESKIELKEIGLNDTEIAYVLQGL